MNNHKQARILLLQASAPKRNMAIVKNVYKGVRELGGNNMEKSVRRIDPKID